MSNRANHPSERSAVTRLAELRGVAFIVDALRAGERAILVIARDETSARTPGAALAACSSDSTWTLRIGPPLPEPSDLQEVIGAAAGISGVRDMAPLAMAARMLFAEPRRNVILAIDEAHLLSHRSLAYLAEMTELLAPDAPVLQIVLAARPALLNTLAHPEFESFRNRLAEPRCETFLTSAKDASERVVSRPKEPPVGWAPPRPSPVESAEPIAPSPWFYRAAHAAAGLVAAGCLATLGYLALPAFSMDPAPLYALLGSSAPQFGSAPSDRAQSPAQLDSKETDEAVDPLMDQLADAVASGSTESVFPLLERIAKLEARLTPDGLRLLIAMPDRLASRAVAASAAGRIDEARRLEQFYLLADSARRRPDLLSTLNHGSIQALLGDKSGASDVSLVETSTRRSEVGEPRGIPAGGLPIPQQPEAEGDGAASSPPAVALAADRHVDDAPSEIAASPATAAPEVSAASWAEQAGGGADGHRAAATPNAAEPRPPSEAPENEAAPAGFDMAAPSGSPPPAPDQTGALGDADRTAPARGAAPPAPAGPLPDQDADAVHAAAPTGSSPIPSNAPGALPAERSSAAAEPSQEAPASNAVAALIDAARYPHAEDAPPALASAPAPPAEGVSGVPALAPVRIVLNVVRGDLRRAGRATEVEQALVAAGVGAVERVPVESQRPGPSIGYYFQSDREAAAGVSRLLEPLIGAVNPAELRMSANLPEPGTIEIAIP